ncbi:hypothetical protein M413DRAFT_377682 [Hebeloma cylindrosporum]|uniref:F-box domain-containing protein n=1 Tax=Hebeloma cylindrosporum TaxID=76867 RepID=A0A0C3C5V7_HEBCY|nr:hypothetical protein M413DRAFT_377682 [Hebeloma cylindrosporum h7]
MFAAVKNVVLAVFNRSRLWQPARVQPEMERPSPIDLCELPVELLTMILEDLDWTDVLRVRETCKKLQEISKARSIWLNLCRPHLTATETAPQILHLERPIHLHTSSELEYHFLRLKSASIGWETDDLSPSRRREIVTTSNPSCMYMVEGGRWFLVASDMGSISYFDLEASDPTEISLVPKQFQDKTTGFVAMAIDVDHGSSFLAFNLVVSYSLSGRPVHDFKHHRVQLWKVSLTLDEQQRGIGLSAEHLASFPQELDIWRVWALSLHGTHLALSVTCPEYDERHRTFVIDWKQADGDSTNYSRRLLHPCYGQVTTVCLRFLTKPSCYSTILPLRKQPRCHHSTIQVLQLRPCG